MFKRLLMAVVFAAAGLLALGFAVSLFLDSSLNQLSYRVYVDAEDRIFVNGELASENRVYDLARDMTVEFELEYHPRATLYFCFKERGCDR